MQNGSNSPHCGCGVALELLRAGIALELPHRRGDDQCQDEQRSRVLISALSPQGSDGSTALPSEPSHPGPLSCPFLCVCMGTCAHRAALCVPRVPQQQGAHQEPQAGGRKGMSCPCSHPGEGALSPLAGVSCSGVPEQSEPLEGARGKQGHCWALLFPVVSPVPCAAAAAAMCWVSQCTVGSGPWCPCPLHVSPC